MVQNLSVVKKTKKPNKRIESLEPSASSHLTVPTKRGVHFLPKPKEWECTFLSPHPPQQNLSLCHDTGEEKDFWRGDISLFWDYPTLHDHHITLQ